MCPYAGMFPRPRTLWTEMARHLLSRLLSRRIIPGPYCAIRTTTSASRRSALRRIAIAERPGWGARDHLLASFLQPRDPKCLRPVAIADVAHALSSHEGEDVGDRHRDVDAAFMTTSVGLEKR